MPTFGQNLQRLRERAGFRTAKRLADALGVVPSVVSRMENDQQGLPEGPTLLRLAKALRRPVDDLLAGVDPDYHPARATSSDTAGNHEADMVDPAAANALSAAREAHVVNDGDLAYVQLKSGERLVKIVTRHKSSLWLSAANPAYPPRFAANDQVVIVRRVVYASFFVRFAPTN